MNSIRYICVALCVMTVLTSQVVYADQKASKNVVSAGLAKPIRIKMNICIMHDGVKPYSYSTEQIMADGEYETINHHENSNSLINNKQARMTLQAIISIFPNIVKNTRGGETISVSGIGQLSYDTYMSIQKQYYYQLGETFPIQTSLKPGETKTILSEHKDSINGAVFLKITIAATIEKGSVEVISRRRSQPSKPVKKQVQKDNEQAKQAGNTQLAQPQEDNKKAESDQQTQTNK